MTTELLVNRVRAEFIEMPDLRLTRPQIQRLFGVDVNQCQSVLDALVAANFLCVKPDGRYARVAGADAPGAVKKSL